MGHEASAGTSAAAAAESTTVVDQPVVESQEIDFSQFSAEQLDTIMENGGVIPDEFLKKPEADPAAAVDEPAAEEKLAVVEGEEEKTAEEIEAAKTAAAEAAPDADFVTNFKFTENADAETLKKEEAEYLSKIEIPEPLQQILDRREALEARIVELEAAPAATEVDELTEQHITPFREMVRYHKNEFDELVPNTQPVIKMIDELYPNESNAILMDLNKAPSTKYSGATRLQEMLYDGFGFDDEAMRQVTHFIANGGKFDVPRFVPVNIDTRVTEAYWTSPDRDSIDKQLEDASYTLSDENATETDKQEARVVIQRLNRSLAQIQDGIDARNRAREETLQKPIKAKEAITNAAHASYTQTALSLVDSVRTDLAKSLDMFDDAGAQITAASFATLIENALSDKDEFAKAAQKALTDQGIKIDWKQGKKLLDDLYTVEERIAFDEKNNSHKIVKKENLDKRADLLKEIKGKQKELLGQITGKLVVGAGKALKAKVEGATRIPVVRPRVNGDQTVAAPTMDFSKMSPEEVRSRIGEMRREAAEAGIPLPG